MDQRRLLELAIEELQRQKATIDADIAAIRAELKGTGAGQTESAPSPGTRRGRRRTAAQRKAQAQKMRAIWAARRARASKPASAANIKEEKAGPKELSAPGARTRKMGDAQKKAVSVKMKEAGKKRKAAADKVK